MFQPGVPESRHKDLHPQPQPDSPLELKLFTSLGVQPTGRFADAVQPEFAGPGENPVPASDEYRPSVPGISRTSGSAASLNTILGPKSRRTFLCRSMSVSSEWRSPATNGRRGPPSRAAGRRYCRSASGILCPVKAYEPLLEVSPPENRSTSFGFTRSSRPGYMLHNQNFSHNLGAWTILRRRFGHICMRWPYRVTNRQ